MVVLPGGQWISGVHGMAAAGWPVTEADWDWEPWEDWATDRDVCLCGIDVEAILERHGVKFTEDIPGFLDVVP